MQNILEAEQLSRNGKDEDSRVILNCQVSYQYDRRDRYELKPYELLYDLLTDQLFGCVSALIAFLSK